jgi:hypothetical protein
MPPRRALSLLFWAAALTLHGASAHATLPSRLERPAVDFYSTLTEAPFARLEAESLAPRRIKHGPFLLPAPGPAIVDPTLTLLDQPCTQEDWQQLLAAAASWERLPGETRLRLAAPDGRIYSFVAGPTFDPHGLRGRVLLIAPSTDPAEELLLHLHLDPSGRPRLFLRPLRAATPAEPATEALDFPNP